MSSIGYISHLETEVRQLREDIEFLAKRAEKANYWKAEEPRDTGRSSNSIVSIAYGLCKLKDQALPVDLSDMDACKEMWRKLPEHRKTGDAITAMNTALNSDYRGKDDTRSNRLR